MSYLSMSILGSAVVIFLMGMRILRPTERGLKETLGKYSGFCNPGFHWVVPFIQTIVPIDITENMVNAQRQDIITKDNLNASVDATIYYKVIDTEDTCKFSQYNVSDYERQLVSLARTTLRSVVGNLTLTDANQKRGQINEELFNEIQAEVASWGICLVRVELKEIDPPNDVQEAMNQVVKAENEKIAAIDYAKAEETKADGRRMAAIKDAEGQAEAIRLVNEAADKYFVGNAQKLKQYETGVEAMKSNTKYVISSDIADMVGNILG